MSPQRLTADDQRPCVPRWASMRMVNHGAYWKFYCDDCGLIGPPRPLEADVFEDRHMHHHEQPLPEAKAVR